MGPQRRMAELPKIHWIIPDKFVWDFFVRLEEMIKMPRPPRIHIEEGLYFITTTGEHGRELFRDESDHEKYRGLLLKYKKQYKFILFAYILMPTYVHLLIELAPGTTISEIMHVINSTYTKYFNGRYERRGHLFQGRFGAVVVEKEKDLSESTGREKLEALIKKAPRSRIIGSKEFVDRIKKSMKEEAKEEQKRLMETPPHKVFVIAGSLAIIILSAFTFYLYATNLRIVNRVEDMFERREAELKEDLEKRYRADLVSYYHAIVKRLQLEKKRTEGLRVR